jgi:hypothetical protein
MNKWPEDHVTGPEVAELLRKVMRREVKIVAVDRSWKEVYAGEVRFRAGGYEIVIFNDCNELDYVDSVNAPDGRVGNFDDWWDARTEPVSLLTDQERRLLENQLESAPVAGPAPSTER